MSAPARRRDVNADSLRRVRAVVTTMAESALETSAEGKLTDLIAKAASEMEQHASASRIMRARGLAQRSKASESLRAANGGAGPPARRMLDVVR